MRLTSFFSLAAVLALCSFTWPEPLRPSSQLPFVCGTDTSVKLDDPLVNYVPNTGGPPTISQVRQRWEDAFVSSTTCKDYDCPNDPNECVPWADMYHGTYTIVPHPTTPDLYIVTIQGPEMWYGCYDC